MADIKADFIPRSALTSIIAASNPQVELRIVMGNINNGYYEVDGEAKAWPPARSITASDRKIVSLGLGGSGSPEPHLPRSAIYDLFNSGALTLSPDRLKAHQIDTFCEKYGFARADLARCDDFEGYAD